MTVISTSWPRSIRNRKSRSMEKPERPGGLPVFNAAGSGALVLRQPKPQITPQCVGCCLIEMVTARFQFLDLALFNFSKWFSVKSDV